MHSSEAWVTVAVGGYMDYLRASDGPNWTALSGRAVNREWSDREERHRR